MPVDPLDLVSRIMVAHECDDLPLITAEERDYTLRAIARSIWIDRMREDLDQRNRPDDHAMRSCLAIIDINAKVMK